ncbi:FAD-dependent oxidoreductase [Stutzerimonas kirkiae]|uniref:FAD-dependent oxidoreductase n=1 Tax=Stutzerimonas kirkiae TaxID=2211392 RepID=A0A4Q9RE20_9GAMM|nr:FAD-dependent oxidoreductase [Stutzerimonas kirkiae]TBU98577.1 FAD-dependent oxidoreductase [Stutzerimonas kirkiae]TBV04249.1 FAD-dependent oxidoreductase [Stutzerimonas kirkiae]
MNTPATLYNLQANPGRPPLRVDVAVLGGGSAGIAAALAAAECACSVALIEQYGFFGGTATIAGVQSYCGFLTHGDRPEAAVGGIGRRVLDALAASGHEVAPRQQGSGNWIILLDPERLKRVLDTLVLAAGVQPLLHCRAVAVEQRAGRIRSLLCSDAQGLFAVEANHYIDASGDSSLAAMAVPQRIQPRLQAATLTVRIDGVEPGPAPDREQLHAAVLDYQRRTGQTLARSNGGFFVRLPWSQSYWAMMVDVDLPDASSPSITRAEIEAREIAHDYLESLRRQVPAFRQARLETSGPCLGVRSTRRVQSQQDIRAADALSARRRSDGIARSAWPCELHPLPGITEYRWIADPGWFHVPYGALIPVDSCNLWLAGSCIGADDEAFGSTRVMGCAFATGQAAGVAAALSCRSSKRAAPEQVRQVLLEQGAIL